MPKIEIPNQVSELLNRLNAYSYRAYIVGRCVRELICEQGKTAVDFDIITNADPERIRSIFEIYTLNTEKIDKGELMVTVVGTPVLISTYRKGFAPDGSPLYTSDVIEDLKRRDFSFNAIAYSPRDGFIDPFGGLECLSGETAVVKTIGGAGGFSGETEPDNQPESESSHPFWKNPVSILQALGYYSTGDYTISPETCEALLKYKNSIQKVSETDLRTELSWVLRGRNVSAVLEEYSEIFKILIPEFQQLENFDLKSDEYACDALTHTYKSVGYSTPVLTLRYAMLFHSLGKPDCFSVDKSGKGHFYGHAERSRIYAERIMRRMGFSEDETREVGFLIKNQDVRMTLDRRSLKLKLREMPPERLKMLLQFRHADLKARSPDFEGAAMACKRQVEAVNEIISTKECYTLHGLAINRYDLMQKGVVKNTEQAKAVLERLLDMVIDSPAFNTRARLIAAAEKMNYKTRI